MQALHLLPIDLGTQWLFVGVHIHIDIPLRIYDFTAYSTNLTLSSIEERLPEGVLGCLLVVVVVDAVIVC
jgi:hypothetical protein